MKSFNIPFLLLAAALLTAGTAAAQGSTSSTIANTKPTGQARAAVVRMTPGNSQITETSRTNAAVDNESYVEQLGVSNYANVDQTGDNQSADMLQTNLNNNIATGNDGYQKQRNGAGTGGNNAFMTQTGSMNYADQDQAGNVNYAIVTQGDVATPRTSNYSVQQQVGGQNYGNVDQKSSSNFAHQSQTSELNSTMVGGPSAGGPTSGNFADTRQGNLTGLTGGANGTDGQWSQVMQNGQNNRAIIRQDNTTNGGNGTL